MTRLGRKLLKMECDMNLNENRNKCAANIVTRSSKLSITFSVIVFRCIHIAIVCLPLMHRY